MRQTKGRLAQLAGITLATALLTACGWEGPVSTGRPGTPRPLISNVGFIHVTTGVQPYDPFAPYAPILDDCVYLGQRDEDDPCTLLRLPVIGLESPVPTVDDVMGRVLVSHAWMGRRFREVIESFPPEFLLLFRPITAIVISGDVRPSFYWTTTAATYLDPNTLWLTDEERRTVTQRP